MTINELHDKFYDLLSTIDRISQEHDLRWFVAYGTAIGAIREKNFIPWDDDMDSLVLAEDYDRFKQVMRNNLPEHLHLIEPQNFSPLFYDFTVRIIDDRWLLREETTMDRAYNNLENRVGIDVFVAAGCPKTNAGRKLFVLKYKVLYGMAMQYRFNVEYDKYSTLDKVRVAILRKTGRIYSGKNPDRIIEKWYQLFNKYDAKETGLRFVINSPIVSHYLKPMPDTWFSGVSYGMIRELRVPLIGGIDQMLREVYGDYMTPEQDTDKYFTHLDKQN